LGLLYVADRMLTRNEILEKPQNDLIVLSPQPPIGFPKLARSCVWTAGGGRLAPVEAGHIIFHIFCQNTIGQLIIKDKD